MKGPMFCFDVDEGTNVFFELFYYVLLFSVLLIFLVFCVVFFVLFVFVSCLVYPTLPLSCVLCTLRYLCHVSCVPYVTSVMCLVYPTLPLSCVLCTICCFCPVSCVPYVASFSGLSILDCPWHYAGWTVRLAARVVFFFLLIIHCYESWYLDWRLDLLTTYLYMSRG